MSSAHDGEVTVEVALGQAKSLASAWRGVREAHQPLRLEPTSGRRLTKAVLQQLAATSRIGVSDALDDAISLMFVAHAKRGFDAEGETPLIPEIEAMVSQMDSAAQLGRLPYLILLTILLEHVMEEGHAAGGPASPLPSAADVTAVLSKPSVAGMLIDAKMQQQVVEGVIILLELRNSLTEAGAAVVLVSP